MTDEPVTYDLDDCPDLSSFSDLARPNLFGQDPALLRDDLLGAMREAIEDQPRSRQTEIGPSELGNPCNRWLAHRFAGTEPVGLQKVPWKAAVGTAIHDHFTDWLHRYNEVHGTRFLADVRVWIGDLYPGRPITGKLDGFDLWTCTVIDLKGLALDTPIPTPSGWATMSSLRVGDRVFGADGKPCRVVAKSAVHDDRPCYRVTFDDGSSVVTDNVHLWRFEADRGGNGARQTVIMSTEDAAGQIVNPATGQRHLRVPNAGMLDLPDIDLPVHPYVLGAWLGDGSIAGGRISKPDEELFDNIKACGYSVGLADAKGITRTVHGLVTQLRALGLVWPKPRAAQRKQGITGVKQVPDIYLRAGTQQRLALLRGLMDTDGTWNRKRSQAVFNSTDKALAHSVAELVRSLGWKARVFEHESRGYGKTVTAYSVPFVPHGANPFCLTRKAELVRLEGSKQSRRRVVKSIEPVPTVLTQCIQVDSSDHMYLCGEDMVPTHNTAGKWAMQTYAPGKPDSPQYDVQIDSYGVGATNAGLTVRNVGLLRVPRDGELHDAAWKVRPHDPQRAATALARAGGIARMVDAIGPAAIPLQPATEHHCGTCPFYSPLASDLTKACPGAESFAAKREQRSASLTSLIA